MAIMKIMKHLEISEKEFYEYLVFDEREKKDMNNVKIVKELLMCRIIPNEKWWDFSMKEAHEFDENLLFDVYTDVCFKHALNTTLAENTVLYEFTKFLTEYPVKKSKVRMFLDKFMLGQKTQKLEVIKILMPFAL